MMGNEEAGPHPCFDEGDGFRVHLPVAPLCSMSCRYCRPRTGCDVSGPGSASRVVSPAEAVASLAERLATVTDPQPVVGVAGPGDPLADPDLLLDVLSRVRGSYPSARLCMCTNGLGLSAAISKLLGVGLSHLTVTVNSLRPEVLSSLHRQLTVGGETRVGAAAGLALADSHRQALAEMAQLPIRTKVNVVVVPGINDGESLRELMQTLVDHGIKLVNLIPHLPLPGTELSSRPESCRHQELVGSLGREFPQLRFKRRCRRCAADAAGFIPGG